MRQPGFTFTVRGIQLLRVLPFYGAGWAWPYAHCKRWQIGFYFHCKRGLYIGFGWSAIDRRIKRRIKTMTAQEREDLRGILADALFANKEPKAEDRDTFLALHNHSFTDKLVQ